MLVVNTILAPSKIEGLGLFAGQYIPKGTVVWKFVPGVDALLDASEIESLPEVTRDICRRYAYLDHTHKKYVLCGDDARFENHSENPNTAGVYPEGEPFGIDVATRDIQEGEEITCDYRTFDTEFSYKFTSSQKNYVSSGSNDLSGPLCDS
ncbi:MAG: SET domain-containing protein [Rhodomicrobium sp.]